MSAIAEGSVFFQAEVADEQTIEQTLREHPRLSGVSFEPVYTSYTASPFRTSMWAKRAHHTPRQRNSSGQVLPWLHLLAPARRPKAPLPTSLAGLERIQLPEQQSHSPSFLTPPRFSRRTALLGLGTFTLVVAGTVIGPRWYNKKIADDRTILTYRGHTASVDSLAWSPDGTRIVSASFENTVQVWDATHGHTILSYRGYFENEAVAWSPDGQFIAFSSDTVIDPGGLVQIWDASDGHTVLIYHGPTGAARAQGWIPWGIAWSPDSKRLASGSFDQTVQVWDATDGHTILIYRGQVEAVGVINATIAVSWSPDGTRIASASFSNVHVWDTTDGHTILSYQEENVEVGEIIPEAVAWSPDGKRIASAFIDGQVQVWDATDGGHIFTYRGHSSLVSAVAWSPDGTRIASASNDQTVRVWDAAHGSTLLTYQGHTDYVLSVAWSPDGTRIASASADTTVRVWNAP